MSLQFAFAQTTLPTDTVRVLYEEIFKGEANSIDFELFERAIIGQAALLEKRSFNAEVITIIDFRKSGNKKRMWILDLGSREILFHTLVAHGRNSGQEFARQFSNMEQSYQSSLGFYLTGDTYCGKHGLSLRLKGLEPGINDKAMNRAIVIHGAKYVSMDFIKQHGRLGRSYGCPAVSTALAPDIIETIKGGTCPVFRTIRKDLLYPLV